ncbi:hypothetical protein H8D36_06145 [archaeon]|nr:hypothetical protein [archaeon]MBL7057002.1 hypothetical protein [Candidatus Woesearchaeota archaeon]
MTAIKVEIPVDKLTAAKGHRKNIKHIEDFIVGGVAASLHMSAFGYTDLYAKNMQVINHFATKLSFLYLELSDVTTDKQEREENILRAVELNPSISVNKKHIIITGLYQIKRVVEGKDHSSGKANYCITNRNEQEVVDLNAKIDDARKKLADNPSILEQYS